MEIESYQARSRDVRRAARAHLAELRRARRSATSRTDGEAVAGAAPELSVDRLDPPPPAAEISNAALAEMVEGRSAADPAATSGPIDPPDPDEAAAEAERLLDSMDVEEQRAPATDNAAASAEPPTEPASDTGVAVAETAGEAEAVADVAVDGPASPETGVSSDLACLPGAGPGLIWMLNACDVHSLADLAAQDAAELAEKLGVVGQIINVDHWVTLAQAGPSSD